MADETRELAKFSANLEYDQIPQGMRTLAIDSIVDQLGCQIGCSELPWAKQIRTAYSRARGIPEATVVRYGDRLPVNAAVFINSTFGHSFEFDDGNTLARGHPGATLIPALMAIAEREHVSGRAFLAAFMAAYEVCCRIGWAIGPEMSEHGGPNTAMTCGPFGAAAGVAKLLGLGSEGIRNAIAIAGTFAGGLQQYDHGGGSVKRVICAIASSNGLEAALLAHTGITGPEEILEGDRGVLKIYTRVFRPERLVADLGQKWLIENIRFKPYSSCGAIHATIDAMSKLMAVHTLKAADIKSIEVGYAKHNVDHVAITAPYDLTGMQFSTSYSLALTVLKGKNTPREYTMEALADPEIKAFASKVSIREDEELTKLKGRLPARVRVRTNSGATYEECVLDPKGSSGAPLSSADIDKKFRAQVTDVSGISNCNKTLEMIRNIESLDDMAKLSTMLAFGNGAA